MKTTSQQLAESIRSKIVSGNLLGGTPLKQDKLAEEYGVSKIPVREALYLLQNEGLVIFINNRGSLVSELSISEVEEIYTMRIALEEIALARAIPNLNLSDYASAEAALKLLEDCQEPTELSALNWQFHQSLYRAAQMPKLLETVSMLHNNVARYLLLYLNALNQQAHSQAEHWELLRACREGKVAYAVGILKQHLLDAQYCTTEYMKAQQQA